MVLINKKTSTFQTNNPQSESEHFSDEYAEAWYELGSPIQLPFLKYMIGVIAYLVDNFFLIKNTYNALTHENFDQSKIIIAGCILGLHLISAVLISIIDSLNKDAISGRRGKYLNNKHKGVILLRMLAHITLTMKLFRYTTAFLENIRRNKQLHILRMRRTSITKKEVQFVVDQKKNQLVESHYDLVESFFKTVPAALLQVFFMFQAQPHAKLRLYSTTDQDRFATVFSTIITTAISTANYQCDYLTFKKVLLFQDCFRSGFEHQINLRIPGDVFLISNIPIQIITIGIRICFYSVLIYWSPVQFLITLGVILTVNCFLTFIWNKTSWRFRPVLENPLFGIPWICFNIIDLWINLFVPGVHYPKPLDHVLNFYTTLITGIVVFRGFDFLSPTNTGYQPLFLPNETAPFPNSFQYVSGNHSEFTITHPEHEDEDSVYFINSLIKTLVILHDYLTFNQMSYAGFFYNVVKFMNIVNLICFSYTCLMNYLKLYDLDFPIQIVNDFYYTIFDFLQKIRICDNSADQSLLHHGRRGEVFLVFSMLPNSQFFGNLRTIEKNHWQNIKPEELDELVTKLIQDGKGYSSFCMQWLDKVAKLVAPVLYPGRFREFRFNWNIPTDKPSIMNSLQRHPLREQMFTFINDEYANSTQNIKLLLAVFCANYNEIVRHYTSLRLKKTFQLLDIPIEKGEPYFRQRTNTGHILKNDYELGYYQRLLREVRGIRVGQEIP